jgi:alkanesulfonate monooxygenase SsuD/methylene tetrahydromethanopterin reductase-like flavin-dependent oxidoreductase (luciferase family)
VPIWSTLGGPDLAVEYVVNLMDAALDPMEWARRREDQGWRFLSVADHFYSSRRPFPHVWVTASALAAATTRARITTAFVNNLFRSPVEVAQAALMMQQVSSGRFELGLGAGWDRAEIVDTGMAYPHPRDRAGAFIEAVQIVRMLMHTGSCEFAGDYYQITVDHLGPVSEDPPLLVASVGGPRTVREVTPHCDRIEIKAASAATRGGTLDLQVMARVTDEHLIEMIARVRAVDPDIGIGLFVLCNAGDDEQTRQVEALMGNGLYERFYGSPSKVVEGMAWLEELGITRCQISPIDDASFDRLAPLIFR